jgi:putative membrane protein
MRRFDRFANDRIHAAVTELERHSAAEVVVKVVAESADYPDLPWRFGAAGVLAAMVASAAMTAADPPLDTGKVLIGLAAAGLVGYFVGDLLRPLRRWMLSQGRLDRAVAAAARLAFHDEALERTRHHTGVMVYASVLEDRVVVVVDRALEGRAPGAAWNRLNTVGAPGTPLLERLLAVLAELGALVATIAPRRDDDVNELSDAPLIG